MNNAYYGKVKEYKRKTNNLDLIIKTDTHKTITRQPKALFKDKNEKYEKFILYSFNKEFFPKFLYADFWVLELFKLETYL